MPGGYLLPGNAVPGEVLSGKKFSAGSYFNAVGTMLDRGAPTITPSTADQALQAGHYTGGTIKGDPNLIAANIVKDKTLFGVVGTTEKREYASGTATPTTVPGTAGLWRVIVSGLGFMPTAIHITDSGEPNARRATFWASFIDPAMSISTNVNGYDEQVVVTNPTFNYYVINGAFSLCVEFPGTAKWEAWK